MLAQYLDKCGHPTDNTGTLVPGRSPRTADAGAGGSTAAASRCACTIGDRRDREALDAYEGTTPRCATTSRTSRSIHPDDVPRSPSSASPPTPGAVGLLRRADDRADDARSSARSGPLAVPVRRPAPRRRAAGDGQRLAGQHARPAARRSTSRSPGRRTASTAGGRSCPSRRSTSRPRSRRTPRARAWINRRDDDAGVLRPVRPPTWSCSTATRSPGRPRDRRLARALDVDRRGDGLRRWLRRDEVPSRNRVRVGGRVPGLVTVARDSSTGEGR
jgi:hypothetical protein